MNQADVPKTPMSELNCDLAVSQAIALIKSYSFDTNGTTAEKLVQKWLNNYQGNWVRLATIEALYLGRYKTVSIEQIMEVWLRIGTPNIHFKGEFERLICRQLPKHLVISDSSGIETEESLPCKSNNGLNETSNYDHWQDRESSDLLNSESSPQAELVYPDNKPPKTLSEVKNILKQATRNKRCRDGGSIFPKFGGLEPEIQSNFPPLQGKGAPRDKERASGASASALAKLPTQGIPIRGQARTKRGNVHQETSNEQQGKCLSPYSSSPLPEDKTQSSDNCHLPYHSRKIRNFHPILDNSSFFDKLKSLAINSDCLTVNHY